MIAGTLFIGAIVISITEFIKRITDKDYRGALLIVLAAIVGAIVGLLDTHIGVIDISVAQGVLTGLAAAGAYRVSQNIG